MFNARATKKEGDEEVGGQMSFLEHLDELRKRLMWSILVVIVAAMGCWFVSGSIFRFLALPGEHALEEAQQEKVTANETITSLSSLKKDQVGRYVFIEETKINTVLIPAGTSVLARYRDDVSPAGLFTDEPLFAGNQIVPKGVRLKNPNEAPRTAGMNTRFVASTAIEPFSLYVKISLYSALCISIPFLLWQIWAFVSPGLYPHERSYVFPFVGLSSVSFVVGAIFAYKIIFPPAAKYLFHLGKDFRLLLKADDYFDFIIMIMLGMGIVFQMPAITYVLARIGLVSARYLVRIWKKAVIVILIVAALVSPTNDIPNMMLFAAPMLALYVISIIVAWIFGKQRSAT